MASNNKYSKLTMDLSKMFRKEEVLSIAKELGLTIKDSDPVRTIMQTILGNMEEEIPDPEECSELMFDFMFNSNIIDEDGNVLEEIIEEEILEEEEEESEENEVPECYTYADESDPSCKKCLLLDACSADRISNRPACYGLLHNSAAEECKICIEALSCSKVTVRNNRSIDKLSKKLNN